MDKRRITSLKKKYPGIKADRIAASPKEDPLKLQDGATVHWEVIQHVIMRVSCDPEEGEREAVENAHKMTHQYLKRVLRGVPGVELIDDASETIPQVRTWDGKRRFNWTSIRRSHKQIQRSQRSQRSQSRTRSERS